MIPTHSSSTATRAANRIRPYVQIRGHASFKDGGTVVLHTNHGRIYIDGRLGSKTKGKLFDRHPNEERAKRITDERIIRSVNEQYEV